MENNKLDVRSDDALNNAMNDMSEVVTRNYLSKLSDYDIVELEHTIAGLSMNEHMRLFKLNKFVYQKDESILDKMSTVFNSMFTGGATAVIIIDSDGSKTDYFLGAVDKTGGDGDMMGQTLSSSLTGNFQGSVLESQSGKQIEEIIKKITDSPDKKIVSSVSSIPSLRKKDNDNTKNYTQGIENVIDALEGVKYTAVIVADPISPTELDMVELSYEQLYTQLSPYAKSTYTFNEAETLGFSHTDTKTISDSINKSVSRSSSTSTNSGWSDSVSDSRTNGNIKRLMMIGGGAAALLGGPGLVVGAAALLAGAAMPDKTHSEANQRSGGTTDQKGQSDTEGKTHTNSEGTTDSTSESNQRGRSLQISSENKTVENMLKKIDEHIARIKACRTYGAFNCSAYIISGDKETNTIVASNYNALVRGEDSSMQDSYVNTWGGNEANVMKQYLAKFTHPVFVRPGDTEQVMKFSAASLITGKELALQAGIPKKSITGVSVVESAPFGRNIYRLSNNTDERKIDIGKIYHMGKIENTKVSLDLDSLASHVFVTGSTGSGKSNTIYELLDKAQKQNVKFLVIEPAKGEYKDVFGGCDNVTVYGTNPKFMDMLKINPFSFPEEIHIYEHLDRLIEIFNACWPMYAAMPAVLKDSVERAYVAVGWDLQMSTNRSGVRIFPTFSDVLNQIDKVMEESQYSSDSKGDYKGALSTRLRSLTTGINSMIFTQNELSNEKLFEENVIVDISRIGSTETKALIMGLLITKLQEYRIAKRIGSNNELRHITVLEEAHNILKRTSTEQSTEGANLLGKSVEMLANAIAEMRTYGEGFIIADQSPGMMDMSVIRNTNTKIILRLPDYSDRELVGKSIGLNEQQIIELSKLPQGVAAIFQNDWLEAVLCKVNHMKNQQPYLFKKSFSESDLKNKFGLAKALLDCVLKEKSDTDIKSVYEYIAKSELSAEIKARIILALNKNDLSMIDIKPAIYDIICTLSMEKEAENADCVQDWVNAFFYDDNAIISSLDENEQKLAIKCIVSENIERYNRPAEYIEQCHKYLEGAVL